MKHFSVSRRRPRTASVVLLLAVACGPDGRVGKPPTESNRSTPAAERHLSTREAHRLAPHAYGRIGDLVLSTTGERMRARYTFALGEDGAGKKPLRGALLDADLGTDDDEDTHLWFRPAWRGADGKVHPLVAAPTPSTCTSPKGTLHEGVRLIGVVDGVTLDSMYCPDDGNGGADGGLRVRTTAKDLPRGAAIADDLGPGPSAVILDHGGDAWEGSQKFTALAVEGPKSTLVVRAERPGTATRTLVRIAKEVFPSPVAIAYDGNGKDTVERTVHVTGDDPGTALGKSGVPTRAVPLGLSGLPGTVTFVDDSGGAFGTRPLPPEGLTLAVPTDFAKEVIVRDTKGVVCGRGPLGAPELARAKCQRNARLGFTVHADGHVPAPFHAIVYGEDGTPDPELSDLVPQDGKIRSVSAKNSIYSTDGRAEIELRPGKYHVLVTRGPGSTLDERHLALGPDASEDVASEIRSVLPKDAFAADFHLHAAPSPDSTVSLAARMITLAAENVTFAVATDHNRITDYSQKRSEVGPVPDGLFPRFAIGDEITSGGPQLYGHFNAFPLAPARPGVSPEEHTIPYFGVAPKELFAGARQRGASIVQVNHPRMPPRIGYFDQTSLDPRTGLASPEFSDDFDAVEAHNGIWLESPDRVREGFLDIVALARRGKMVAATGNSDSHKLFLEEPGYPRTYVFFAPGGASVPLTERVVAALRARSTVVSSGPYLEATLDGALPGSVVAAKHGAKAMRLRIRVTAPAWVPVEVVSILVDGELVRSFPVMGKRKNGVRFERELEWPVSRDATVAVWVSAREPLPRVLHEKDARAIAFTTPFYVDADGDGKVTLTR